MDDLALRPWHWPDREHGKRASRKLREEHNHAVNAGHALYEALRLEEEFRQAEGDAPAIREFKRKNNIEPARLVPDWLEEKRRDALSFARKSYAG